MNLSVVNRNDDCFNFEILNVKSPEHALNIAEEFWFKLNMEMYNDY